MILHPREKEEPDQHVQLLGMFHQLGEPISQLLPANLPIRYKGHVNVSISISINDSLAYKLFIETNAWINAYNRKITINMQIYLSTKRRLKPFKIMSMS